MIYTCTLNPSIDYIMHVDEFKSGDLNRAKQTFFYPGGKGINVSRVMARLGVETIALGYTAGFTGAFIKDSLKQEHIQNQFIETDGKTRVNVKLKSSDETEINGPGPLISEAKQQELLQQVKEMTDDDTLVIAGSVPSSLPDDFYVEIAEICQKQGTKLVADTSGKALQQLIGSSLFLIKPNHHELADLFNAEVETKEQAAYYGRKLFDQGVSHVIVSMGGEGAVYIGEDQQLFAEVPKGTVKNSVGAGDSMVAGFTAAISQAKPVEEAFRQAVASGSATAFQDDLCNKEDVEQLLNDIEISTIKEETK
ncbi:1-phosphofructokinase [Halobacillus salinus]|uniref:Tagatose-6-phosphate kinase n=1 Tax=Halobacillus salinus TaxID=192814 RepID=A0A4Z0H0F2_9BACI|nr:1-phosphofructokinase [Halobacillus salinus]TGB02282.1 1-phosphofructokinase [Halobacillus salinus]